MNMKQLIFILNFLMLQLIHFTKGQESEVFLEFEETNIRNLMLNIKWGFRPGLKRTATRFLLLSETKRINFSTFLYDYGSPELIDDEAVIKVSQMKAENFIKRVPIYKQSSLDCSLNCINSTKFYSNNLFECNIFYYDPSTKTCVLYEYDFNNTYKKKRNDLVNDIYEYFNDDCDMDEILGDMHGYSRLCKRILDYRDSHIVKINPFIDYRFSISIRDENNKWTPYFRKEYQYAPKINIEVIGDIRLGNNISLVCKTDLSPSIVDSITWKNNNPVHREVLKINSLNLNNMQQTYFCEIRFNFFRMIQKAFKLNITSLAEIKPVLKMNYSADVESLNFNLNWKVLLPSNSNFRPEKIILLYSENNQTFKFVNKYLLFELSKSDHTKLDRKLETISASNEDECAMKCLLKSTCDHFVYTGKEPYEKSQKSNCKLSSKTNDNSILCAIGQVCATLSPYEKHIFNNSLTISILPNITYKFKLQVKDKHLGWTDPEETGPIFLPLKLWIEQKGDTFINDTENGEFSLICNTKIKQSVQHEIHWLKDDKEILEEDTNFIQIKQKDKFYGSSVLEFNLKKNLNISQFTGVYKCVINVRYPDISASTSYQTEPKKLDFLIDLPMKYNQSFSNVTLPTLPGMLLEFSCEVFGSGVKSLNWFVNDVNYNEKLTFPDNDEPFIISYNESYYVHNILVIKTDNPRKISKLECIMNNNLTIRKHYVTVVDEKPQLDVKIDKSELNNFKLSFELKLKNFEKNTNYLNIESKPLKYSILYVENSTFNGAFQTYIAPDTLSFSNMSKISPISNRIPIGILKSTQHGIQSCKLMCYQIAFCKLYEYLTEDDSCNLYSNTQMDNYYKSLIEQLKQINSDSNFNLIHLIRGELTNVYQEELFFNNTIIIDKKNYKDCEARINHVDDIEEEEGCSDELAEYKETYSIDNLIPLTSYQFRIEVSNAFGKSVPYLTDEIEIPFPLNLIVERQVDSNNKFYMLECSTPLVDFSKLKLIWYRNENLIDPNDNNYQQIILTEKSGLQSQLVFKSNPSKLIGYYTCVLEYISGHISMTRNESFIFRPTIEPIYPVYKDSIVYKQLGDILSEPCSVEAWPFAQVQWLYKNKLVSNSSDLSQPYMINHHKNITVTSYLIVQNISNDLAGNYSCVLNGKLQIKNITVQIVADQDKIKDDKDSQSQNLKPNEKSKNKLLILIPILAIAVLISITAFSIYIYFKRKKLSLETSLSYNRIEEELMTGVDNANLTEDQ